MFIYQLYFNKPHFCQNYKKKLNKFQSTMEEHNLVTLHYNITNGFIFLFQSYWKPVCNNELPWLLSIISCCRHLPLPTKCIYWLSGGMITLFWRSFWIFRQLHPSVPIWVFNFSHLRLHNNQSMDDFVSLKWKTYANNRSRAETNKVLVIIIEWRRHSVSEVWEFAFCVERSDFDIQSRIDK